MNDRFRIIRSDPSRDRHGRTTGTDRLEESLREVREDEGIVSIAVDPIIGYSGNTWQVMDTRYVIIVERKDLEVAQTIAGGEITEQELKSQAEIDRLIRTLRTAYTRIGAAIFFRGDANKMINILEKTREQISSALTSETSKTGAGKRVDTLHQDA